MAEQFTPGDRRWYYLKDVDGTAGTIAAEDDFAGAVTGTSNTQPSTGLVSLPHRNDSTVKPSVRVIVVPMIIATGAVVARGDLAFAIQAIKVIAAPNRKEPAGTPQVSITIDSAPRTEDMTGNREIDVDVRGADLFSVRLSAITDVPGTADRLRIFYWIDE